MTRDTKELVRRVLDQRATAIRDFASSVRDAVLKDKLTAPFNMRAEGLTAMWNLTQIRREMSDEIHSLAILFKDKEATKDEKTTEDCRLRIARISIARYFIDLVEKMQKASTENGSPAANAIFQSAVSAIKHILDDKFFTKDKDQIINDHLDVEPVIAAACSAFSIPTSTLYDAVGSHEGKVAQDIDREIGRIRAET
ncbi:MAG: hypothetical protein ABH842_04965 [Candidatus Micrarchaeota archaeon]